MGAELADTVSDSADPFTADDTMAWTGLGLVGEGTGIEMGTDEGYGRDET